MRAVVVFRSECPANRLVDTDDLFDRFRKCLRMPFVIARTFIRSVIVFLVVIMMRCWRLR